MCQSVCLIDCLFVCLFVHPSVCSFVCLRLCVCLFAASIVHIHGFLQGMFFGNSEGLSFLKSSDPEYNQFRNIFPFEITFHLMCVLASGYFIQREVMAAPPLAILEWRSFFSGNHFGIPQTGRWISTRTRLVYPHLVPFFCPATV